jgi:predicted dehydrogenase
MKIKIGIIGTGNISSMHILGFKSHPKVEVVALCDKRRKTVEKMADRWNINRIYRNYHDVLKQQEIDAVAILTPHHLHAPIAIAAAETGKHILVEKPIAVSLDEADQMIRAAEKAGVFLMVAENQVFHPPHVEAKRLIDEGEIGIPVMIRMSLGWATGRMPEDSSGFIKALAAFEERNLKENKDWESGDMWRLDPSKRGGGSLIDEGHHRFSVADYLLGEFENINVYLDELQFEQFDFSWEYAGVIGWKHLGKRCYGILSTHLGAPEFIQSEGGSIFDDRIELTGSDGYLWIRGCEGRIMDSPPLQLLKKKEMTSFTNIKTGYAAGFKEMTHHFIDSLLSDKPPRFTGKDGKRILQIILSAYESAREKRLIYLT